MIHQLIFYPSNDRYLIGEIYKFRSKAGDSMTQYIQQLKDDQSTLQGILENRRGDLDENGDLVGAPTSDATVNFSMQSMHEAYISTLEDALSIVSMLIEYSENRAEAR
jgi:hypothetical protein